MDNLIKGLDSLSFQKPKPSVLGPKPAGIQRKPKRKSKKTVTLNGPITNNNNIGNNSNTKKKKKKKGKRKRPEPQTWPVDTKEIRRLQKLKKTKNITRKELKKLNGMKKERKLKPIKEAISEMCAGALRNLNPSYTAENLTFQEKLAAENGYKWTGPELLMNHINSIGEKKDSMVYMQPKGLKQLREGLQSGELRLEHISVGGDMEN